MPKNKIEIKTTIESCHHCPHACALVDEESNKRMMYCKQKRSLILLRKDWGERPIPDWCPFVKK